MKLIIAIIQPSRLESVKQALSEVEVFRLTVLDVQGIVNPDEEALLYRDMRIDAVQQIVRRLVATLIALSALVPTTSAVFGELKTFLVN